MNVRSMMQHRAALATVSAESDAAIRARAVLEQMYAYFDWDDLPFNADAVEPENYAQVA